MMLKKLQIISILLLIFVFTADGQIIKRYGLKFGLSSATQNWEINGDKNEGVRNQTGIDVGGFIDFFHASFVGVYTELHYIQKGMKENIPVTSFEYHNNVKLHYLSLSILPRLKFGLIKFDCSIFLGPRLDFLLAHKIEVTGEGPEKSTYADRYAFFVKKFRIPEAGITAGLGIQTRRLFGFLTGLEFRYSPNIQQAYSNSLWKISNSSFEFLIIIGN
jgi:hypothetical protein